MASGCLSACCDLCDSHRAVLGGGCACQLVQAAAAESSQRHEQQLAECKAQFEKTLNRQTQQLQVTSTRDSPSSGRCRVACVRGVMLAARHTNAVVCPCVDAPRLQETAQLMKQLEAELASKNQRLAALKHIEAAIKAAGMQ